MARERERKKGGWKKRDSVLKWKSTSVIEAKAQRILYTSLIICGLSTKTHVHTHSPHTLVLATHIRTHINVHTGKVLMVTF